jgi:peptidoglycan/LPS O-acetylase OafA/YrhL
MTTIGPAATNPRQREVLLDFYRSCAMLFVFYHHTVTIFPGFDDIFRRFNPFAEIFVLISGFMVGMIYLYRPGYAAAVLDRSKRIFAAYFLVALPVAIGAALIGKKQEPVLGAILSVLTFRSDPTAIGILKFYGFMFALLPIILPLYRMNRWAALVVSAGIFVATTFVVHVIPPVDGDPLWSLLLVLPQWQFFFMTGIFLGDLHRAGRLIGSRFYIGLGCIFIVGLAIDLSCGFPSNPEKWPYTFEKFANLLWTLPLVLAILFAVYARIKNSLWTSFILNVGRNSLIAFLLSEIVRQSVRFCVFILGMNPHLPAQHMIGISSVALVTFLLWEYQPGWRDRIAAQIRLISGYQSARRTTRPGS